MKLTRNYEPEVDGLRALAVLIVVLFHIGFKGFGGGFIGVDIFFVISGYLISRNIIYDIEAGKFTFKEFYIHRARRIFPAMYATMLFSLIAGFLIFSQIDLQNFGASLVYASAALQNIFFWHQTDYWDTSKDYKPILHFWSLAVEEQFYFFWPLFIFLFARALRRHKGKALGITIFIISIVSLAASQYCLSHNMMAAFYLTPFRVFEFGIGALLLWLSPFTARMPNTMKEIVVVLSTIAIGFAVKCYSEKMAFPGVAALLPCIAAGAIIAARSARYSGWIYRNRVAVWIGFISYSLYLVHWPLIVFFKYTHLTVITHWQKRELLVVSFAVAYLMYRFIERTFRRRGGEKPRFYLKPAAFFGVMVVLLVGLAIPAAYAWQNQRLPSNIPTDLATMTQNVQNARKERENFLKTCLSSESGMCRRIHAAKHYAILGDSFAEDFGIGLFRVYPKYEITLSTQGGCKALHNYINDRTPIARRNECAYFYDQIFQHDNDWSKYDAVILAMAWKDENIPLIAGTIDFFQTHGAKRIILVGPKVTLKTDVPKILASSKTLDEFLKSSAQEMDFAQQKKLQTAMSAIAKSKHIEFFDIAKAECLSSNCQDIVPGTLQPIIWDTGHFTLPGAQYVATNAKAQHPL